MYSAPRLAGSSGRHRRYSHLHCVKAERFQARWLDAMRPRRRCLLAFIARICSSPDVAPCRLFCLLFDAALVELCPTGSRAAPAGTFPYYRQPVQGTVGRQYASPQSALTCRYSLGESSSSLLTRLSLVLSPMAASPQASRGSRVAILFPKVIVNLLRLRSYYQQDKTPPQRATAPCPANGWVFIMCSP